MAGVVVPSAEYVQGIVDKLSKESTDIQSEETILKPPGSSLPLSLKQLNALVEYCCEEVEAIKTNNTKWYEERDHFLKEHENVFHHREQPGSIYEKSNISFNQSRRNLMPVIARLTQDYLGTVPFFSISPIKEDDDSGEGDKLQDWSQFKLSLSNIRECLMDSIETSGVVGERVVKIVHKDCIDYYMETDIVLVDDTGNVVRDQFGDPIYHDDQWVMPQVDPNEADLLQAIIQKVFPNVPDLFQVLLKTVFPDQTQLVLEKDTSIQQPPNPNFIKCTYEMKKDRYSGPHFHGINHRDFICPETVSDIQEAPLVGHQMSMLVSELVERFAGPDVDASTFDAQEKEYHDYILRNLCSLENEDTSPKSNEAKPILEQKEESKMKNDRYNSTTRIVECYLKVDPFEDGRLREICITISTAHRFAYTWDYTANVGAPEVKRPFRVNRFNPVPNRWYGSSEYKLGKHKQEFIDWCLNRMVWDNAVSGQFRFYNPDAIEGGQDQPPMPGDKWHKLKAGFDKDKALFTITMPAVNDNTYQMMQAMMQASQADSGNLAPGGDTMAALPSSKLKYGIEALERAGDAAYGLKAINCQKGIHSIVEAGIYTAIAYMQAQEEFQYNDSMESKMGIVNRTEIEQMRFRVRMELTLKRGDQLNEQNDQATQIVLLYMSQPPTVQILIRPFLVERLKSMDIHDSEKSLPEVTQDQVAQYQQAMAQQQQQQNTSTNTPAPVSTSKPPPGAKGSENTPPPQPIKI